jgi:virulence factor Mce-like protein
VKGRGPDRATLAKFLAFATVTTLLTLYIAQQIVGSSFTSRYHLTATFDDVSGLLPGDQVKVAGAPVGRVDSIKVVDGKARVKMSVDDGVRLPADSTAAVRWRNLLGQRMVYLEPGSSQAKLQSGATITRTKSVVDLGDIVNSLGPLTRNLNPDQLNTVLTAFSKTLEGNETNINTTIYNLDGLLATFAARKQAIDSMVRNFKTLGDTIATRDTQIQQSVDNLASLTRTYAANTKVLDDAVTTISQTTGSLNTVLGGNEAQLGRIVANLSNFAGTFRINVNALEKMVRQLPLTLRSLFSAGNGGHYLRTDALCINLVAGPCPFTMTLPGSSNPPATAQPAGSADDLARLAQMLRGGR